MGCSVSTQSGVGGLYAMPNDDDEGIPYWLPTNNNSNNSDVMEEDNNESPQQQYISSSHSTRRTSNTNRQKNQHIKKRPRGPSQQQQDCCAAAQSETTAQWSTNLCSNTITESPQRKPFPCTLAQAADDGVIDSVPCNLNEDTTCNNPSSTLLKPKSKLNHSPTIMDHPLAISTPQQQTTHQIEENESPTIFSDRQWLVLPEQKYDMNTLHPSNVTAPFLGSMYWIPASPKSSPLKQTSLGGGRKRIGGLACQGSSDPSCLVYGMSGDSGVMDGNKKNVPSLISPTNTIEDYSPMENISPDGDDEGIIRPFTNFGLQDMSMTSISTPTENNNMDESSLGLQRAEKLLLSLNSTEEWDEEVDAGEDYDEDEANDTFETQDGVPQGSFLHQENMTPQGETVDISRELLDYSELEESYVLDAVKSYQPPRQLFDNGGNHNVGKVGHNVGESSLMDNMLDESFEVVTSTTPSKERRGLQNIDDVQKKDQPSTNKKSKGMLPSLLCMAPATNLLDSPVKVEKKNGQETTRVVTPPCPPSPNVATFHTQGGSRRERHVSTLPSVNIGQPIRLRVTDKSSHRGASSDLQVSLSQQDSPCDYVSYDPYFSTGKYTITLPNGRPYGNGLVIKMGHGEFMILQDSRGAVLAVIKSRYTHTPSMVMYSPKKRFTNQLASGHRLTRRGETIVIVDGNEGEALYPWALISKGGRTMGDDCSIHVVNDNTREGGKKSTSSGIFNSEPSFRGRHEFDRDLHTHTVVNRTTTFLEEVPCCVIVRDSSNLDAVDITIAPGKSALVLFYHVNGCAQYIILVIWLLHLTYICLCLTAFATHMN